MDWLHTLFLQLSLSLFCLAALSSPLDRRDSVFAIANLSAKALPLSHRVEYFFLAKPGPADADMVQCSTLVTGLNESLCSVPLTACEGGGLSFEWRQFDNDGAELRVVRNLSSLDPPLVEAGGHRIGGDEIAVLAAGTQFRHQAYVGPNNFSMPMTALAGVD
ncbi:hypothetical protein MAPG_04798 [Magnaporthiopsis poae ATCC 64411]|uniref:Uncharacterized protein n=1 Tax=Magnaporthiopsis poae (strain ATCC 64411 / 73-15) TaxID=644358 RepID=A0A0C4DXP4_MAGP6|nr:hypothetical protein MAPG_04798 [Magnaporthiopsis poae ATCC 64411]